MNKKIYYSSIKMLLGIREEINHMWLPDYNKEKILKILDQEIYLVRSDLISMLGEEEYEKIEESNK